MDSVQLVFEESSRTLIWALGFATIIFRQYGQTGGFRLKVASDSGALAMVDGRLATRDNPGSLRPL